MDPIEIRNIDDIHSYNLEVSNTSTMSSKGHFGASMHHWEFDKV